ncbi:MAG TPA: (d)CMP kinase [Oligoflexia bacterium]|nr:(d)CMP kinase [Oligoflexia bacterium]HMP47152.1 (d)CMP kinase [Oligoflexia bacterium]
MKDHVIITIDGPAGSGKSTIASKLAQRLGFIHLNSGILYRAIGRIANEKGVSHDDEKGLIYLCSSAKFDFSLDPGNFRTRVTLNFPSLGNYSLNPEELYGEECSHWASLVGTSKAVREALTSFQRELGSRNSLVLEGRDAGSVVFPDADFKFYLDASLDERVRRRALQFVDKLDSSSTSAWGHDVPVSERENGTDFTSCEDDAGGVVGGQEKVLLSQQKLEELRATIAERDRRDSTRLISPSEIPEGSVVIDTDGMEISNVLDQIISRISLKY